jgi:hypothetical protein
MAKTDTSRREPGEILAQLLRQGLPREDWAAFIAVTEQKARMQGDLEMLREIRAYKQKYQSGS